MVEMDSNVCYQLPQELVKEAALLWYRRHILKVDETTNQEIIYALGVLI